MNTNMSVLHLVAIASLASGSALAQNVPRPALPPPTLPPVSREVRPSSPPTTNYELAIELREGQDHPDVLKIVTTEGRVTLDTDTGRTVEIDSGKIPITMNLTGTLKVLEPDRCQLDLFLGWTVPYVTGTATMPGGKVTSTVQQTRFGVQTTVLLSMGEPVVVQSNALRQITVTLNELPSPKRPAQPPKQP